jgi:hypothetical protein
VSSAHKRKLARGLLFALYWARDPATDGQAAELARAPRPLGPNLACSRPVDLSRPVPRISIRRPTARIGRSKPASSQSPVNPSPIPSPPPRSCTHRGGGGLARLVAGRRGAAQRCPTVKAATSAPSSPSFFYLPSLL